MKQQPEKNRTIWVVDDSVTDANRVRKLLSDKYQIEVFHDGAIVLEKLSSGELPDLLLLDWIMPGITGIEVCRYVRSSKSKLALIPIILLTAQHGKDEIVEAFRAGANDYLSKPFVDEELKARVNSLLTTKTLLERAEAAEADIRSFLINAPDTIIVIDANGRVTFINEEGLSLLNRSPDEVIGKELSQLIPEINLRHMGLGKNDPLLPTPEITIGDRILSPSFKVLHSDNANFSTLSLRDITERKKVENKRLDFYSIIAHDLRTPITSVLLRLQLIFRGKYGILPPALMDDIQKIESSLRSQVAMINDFLELARLETVHYNLDKRPVNLNDLIRETTEEFLPLLEKNEIELKLQLPPSGIVISGDPQRLTQVLANLVSNAIKFTPLKGSITISLECNDKEITIYVRDTGRGIDAREIESLFDRFTRTSDSEASTTGTGLGLMIVREIIEAHGGFVGVESEIGKGSSFWLRLPR